MFTILAELVRRVFRVPVAEAIKCLMEQAVVRYHDLAQQYFLLHDVAKKDCLTLQYTGGYKEEVTWAEWQTMLAARENGRLAAGGDGEALAQFCEEARIERIQYFQKGRKHGVVAAERLRSHTDISPLVVRTIGTHDIAFTFGDRNGINLPLWFETFGDFTEDELGFMFLVNYADQVSSLGPDGQPDLRNFFWLAKTYLAAKQFLALKARLEDTPGLDGSKVEGEINRLRQSKEAFQSETADQEYDRSTAACEVPTYDRDKLEAELKKLTDEEAIDSGTATEIFEAVLATGQIPSELGRRLGKANSRVRSAIGRATK